MVIYNMQDDKTVGKNALCEESKVKVNQKTVYEFIHMKVSGGLGHCYTILDFSQRFGRIYSAY